MVFECAKKIKLFVRSHERCVVLYGADSCPSCCDIKHQIELNEIPLMFINIEKEKEYAEAAGITEIPWVSFYSNGKKIANHGDFKEKLEVFKWLRACSFASWAQRDNSFRNKFWNIWNKFWYIFFDILTVIFLILIASCIWTIVCFIWNLPKSLCS